MSPADIDALEPWLWLAFGIFGAAFVVVDWLIWRAIMRTWHRRLGFFAQLTPERQKAALENREVDI